jgi:hypothetical protein
MVQRAATVVCQLSSVLYICRESSTNQLLFMQNKANVKIGKMNIRISIIKDYDKEQRTINNERYSKQTQTKPISKAKNAAAFDDKWPA